MGRHSKPTNYGKVAAVVGSGAFAAVPLTSGTAMAADTHPGINWGPIIHCESHGNPRVHNSHSSATGLFQFLSGTWRSLGGLAFGRTAADASPAEQIEIANRAYARDGLTPWDSSRTCWQRRNVYSDVEASYPRYQRPQYHRATQYRGRHGVATRSYRVLAGDTLSSIAAANGHTWRELFQENRSVLHNPNLINVGVVINL